TNDAMAYLPTDAAGAGGSAPPAPAEAGCVVRPDPRGGGDPVDHLAGAPAGEGHRARLEGEEGVVLAPADVVAGVEVGAALTHDDHAGLDDLTAEALHTEALGVGVAAVPGGAGALLVSHLETCLLLVWRTSPY